MSLDVIIPVPIHRKRHAKRGYNQSELLSEEISKILGVSVDTTTLVRKKNTSSQTRMSAKKRQTNLLGAFGLSNTLTSYESVLLVDDVYTTGATLLECIKLLKQKEIKKIHILTILRGEKDI